MTLVKLLFPLLFSASSIYASFLTITRASSTVTETLCTTTLGQTSSSSVPTSTYTQTLWPEVALIVGVSTPVKSVTPPLETATATVQEFSTTTITGSTATGTFSTTTTVFKTDSETITETAVSTTTFTEISTSVITSIIPASLGWISVEDSTGQHDRSEKVEGNSPQANTPDYNVQQPLPHNRMPSYWSSLGRKRTSFPPWFPGHGNDWDDMFPSSVTCVKYVHTHYVKEIIFIKPFYTTTTVPAPTSTTTSTEVITTTSTVVPDSITMTESFATTSTTTTTFTSSVTDTSSTTAVVIASTTTSSYAACFTENTLGPELDNGKFINSVSVDTPGGIQDVTPASTAYDCCVRCLLSNSLDVNCEYSIFKAKEWTCGRYLNPVVCPAQNIQAGKLRLREDAQGDPSLGWTASNGPCGKIVS